jgi:hypothetical protein
MIGWNKNAEILLLRQRQHPSPSEKNIMTNQPILRSYREFQDWELDAIVNAEFGKIGWNFASIQNANNDSSYRFTNVDWRDPEKFSLDGLTKWSDTPMVQTDGYHDGNGCQNSPEVAIILNELCRRKVIPQGNYLITCSW